MYKVWEVCDVYEVWEVGFNTNRKNRNLENLTIKKSRLRNAAGIFLWPPQSSKGQVVWRFQHFSISIFTTFTIAHGFNRGRGITYIFKFQPIQYVFNSFDDWWKHQHRQPKMPNLLNIFCFAQSSQGCKDAKNKKLKIKNKEMQFQLFEIPNLLNLLQDDDL